MAAAAATPSLLYTLRRDGPSAFFPRADSSNAGDEREEVREPFSRDTSDGTPNSAPPEAMLLNANAPVVTPLPAPTPTLPVSQVVKHHCSGFAFPNCRTVLWDSSEQGPKVFVGVEDVLPDVTVPAHVLAHVQGALAEPGSSPGTLRSTLGINRDHESLRYEVLEYVPPGRSSDEKDDGVLLTISNAQQHPDAGQSEREAAVRTRLADRSPTSVDALFRPHLAVEIAQPSATADQFRLRVSAEISAPSATVVATPIRSLRVLPNPLSKSLAAAQSVRAVACRSGDGCKAHADDMQAGYVTIDACRRCVAMHVNDAKTWEWPMVGVWVSDVESVYDSLVWAACTRFCHCHSISERVAQNGAFLLLLYARGQHSPQMYEWRLSPTVAESGATPVQFENFKAPLEFPLSALRSDAAAAGPFVFSLGRSIPRGARGTAAALNHHSRALDGTQVCVPDTAEAAVTMSCPEPQAPPLPATLSFVDAASTASQPPAWSPLRINKASCPISQTDQAPSVAKIPQAASTSLLPTQQVAAQQATIDRLENTVRLLQQQVLVLSKNVCPRPNPSEQKQSTATNTSFLWHNEAMKHQLTVLNQDVPPRVVSSATNTSFLWQHRQPSYDTTSLPGAAAELQTAMSRFAESCQANQLTPPGAQSSPADGDTVSTSESISGRSRVCVEPVLSPARSAQVASRSSYPAQTKQVDTPADIVISSDGDEQFSNNHNDAVSETLVSEPSTPARSGRTFQLPSAAATPPSPPEPVWRTMANYCADLNVSTIDIPRVRLPESLTLSRRPAQVNNEDDEDDENEADEQHDEDIDEAIESMYARKYSLADFIEPCGALDGRQLFPGGTCTDSDDDGALATQLSRFSDGYHSASAGSVSSVRPALMQTPADLSFVGSVGVRVSSK